MREVARGGRSGQWMRNDDVDVEDRCRRVAPASTRQRIERRWCGARRFSAFGGACPAAGRAARLRLGNQITTARHSLQTRAQTITPCIALPAVCAGSARLRTAAGERRVLDSAPSLRAFPRQGRCCSCRLLVPAIFGCCSLLLRWQRQRGGMCERNRPSRPLQR